MLSVLFNEHVACVWFAKNYLLKVNNLNCTFKHLKKGLLHSGHFVKPVTKLYLFRDTCVPEKVLQHVTEFRICFITLRNGSYYIFIFICIFISIILYKFAANSCDVFQNRLLQNLLL